MEKGLPLSRYNDDSDGNTSIKVPYQRLVGSFIFAMIATCVDITYAVSALSRYCSNPSKAHEKALMRIQRYLKQTKNYGIIFGRERRGLFTYSDADHAGDKDTRRSTTGYVSIIHGGAVGWKSRLQPTVALSTTEAEYMAIADATKEVLWLAQLV
jgi:hypothetical protein